MAEKYVRLVQDMYEGSKTVVRFAVGTTKSFKVKVRQHQGSVLILFQAEQRLECWRYVLERKGMKVSRSKTKHLCINGGNDKETVKMEDTKVSRVKELKYLGSMVQESGSCEREIKRRVQAGKDEEKYQQ